MLFTRTSFTWGDVERRTAGIDVKREIYPEDILPASEAHILGPMVASKAAVALGAYERLFNAPDLTVIEPDQVRLAYDKWQELHALGVLLGYIASTVERPFD